MIECFDISQIESSGLFSALVYQTNDTRDLVILIICSQIIVMQIV